jgi:hypothetical protein
MGCVEWDGGIVILVFEYIEGTSVHLHAGWIASQFGCIFSFGLIEWCGGCIELLDLNMYNGLRSLFLGTYLLHIDY